MIRQRFDAIDSLRGLAMVWMTLFHFSFDLNHFGLIRQDFYHDPVWTWQRVMIVSLFLFCAGLGQAVALAQGQGLDRFWRRWSRVAACALLVSFGSWLMFPKTFIYFGILHGIALMLIVVRNSAHWGRVLWLAGAVAIASKFVAAAALQHWGDASLVASFNAPTLNWLGWITRKPVTEDYAPLFPWLGVMWWGAASGAWLLRRPVLLQGLPASLPLAWLGRHSLSYYMLHQPVLIALVWLLSRVWQPV